MKTREPLTRRGRRRAADRAAGCTFHDLAVAEMAAVAAAVRAVMQARPRRRRTKYGRRPDGRARDPYKNSDDARALGYRSAADFRAQRGERYGVSRGVSVGHGARTGETGLGELADFELTFIATGPTGAYLHHDLGTLADVRKAGKTAALARSLREGRISPEDFSGRIRRIGPIAGIEPESDPAPVLAVLRRTTTEDWVFYTRPLGGSEEEET